MGQRLLELPAGADFELGEDLAQVVLSPRTVEWHLSKVFTKLEISSRMQLQRALPDGEQRA